ncbi:unnamed protein product [Prorocentrum cordatum]|uniref:Uncharacterized protein n=1 Tax=Prorocentrum cordatum TaxID=2364126 RepID=A0ABN9TF47_9DINO|nr:unnamed protein product [Polarella glacialis]
MAVAQDLLEGAFKLQVAIESDLGAFAACTAACQKALEQSVGFSDYQNVVQLWALPRPDQLSFRRVYAGVFVWAADSTMGHILKVEGHMTDEQASVDDHSKFCKAGSDLADHYAKLGALARERPIPEQSEWLDRALAISRQVTNPALLQYSEQLDSVRPMVDMMQHRSRREGGSGPPGVRLDQSCEAGPAVRGDEGAHGGPRWVGNVKAPQARLAHTAALDAGCDHAAAFCLRRAAAEAACIGPPPGLEPPAVRPPGAWGWPAAAARDEPMKVSILASAPPAMELTSPPQHHGQQQPLQGRDRQPLGQGQPRQPAPAPRQQRQSRRPPPPEPQGQAEPQGRAAPCPAGRPRAPPSRATLVIAYFPRAASDEEVCRALDGAVGRVNSVRHCHPPFAICALLPHRLQ